jgi:hypothetical protein
MPDRNRLVAWVEPQSDHEFVAAFVSSAAQSQRAPAIQHFHSMSEARGWVEDQAAAFGGVPVDWVDRPGKE